MQKQNTRKAKAAENNTESINESVNESVIFQDDYFSFQTTKPTKSIHPSPVKIPLNDVLSIVRENYSTKNLQNNALEGYQEDDFPLFLKELKCGLNIIIFGYGSKRFILEEFGKYCVKECAGTVCKCDGYMSLSFPSFLKSILESTFSMTKVGKSINETCAIFEKIYNQEDAPVKQLFLLIHNIDSKQFQNLTMQNAIQRLSDISGIHIVGTVDHINAPLLQAINPASSNFVWHELTTYEKYIKEVKFMSPMAEKITTVDSDKQESTANVLKALPIKTRRLFQIIALYLIENPESKGYPESEFLKEAIAGQVFQNQKSIEGGLVELIDHKIIQKKLDSKENDWVLTNFDRKKYFMVQYWIEAH